MRISLLTVFFMTFTFPFCSHSAGVQVGRTRIIYDASKKEVALPLTNKEKDLPWLIQSWTDIGDGKTRGPFIITPPLFRLDAQKEQNLRITWSGQALPTDHESLFYMNVRTIPAMGKDEDDKNVLRLIYKTRLKLFWRPKGLHGTPVDTCKNLRFINDKNHLLVTNDGDFYSVFDSLKVGNTSLTKAELVAPKATVQFALPTAITSSKVSWRCITDYGNATEEFTSGMKDGA
ncbi:FimC family chaperone [Buttiauxella brennerae ATCC 51605]|uniref:FimC family chaperone n=1 Tax=Buttiauxella brennerae ATCC 51605 TaxID=1354251 RepID=A0A1B7IR50_9ENTR|nr:molecular chaperone [Buttiauxella brennerae]OAT32181.1 FimC family chaperone [Buttiauxella brennerae ATCC 51605]